MSDNPQAAPPQEFRLPGHDVLAITGRDAVAFAQALGQLPEELALYGIAGRDFALGADVSPPVRAAVPAVVARILADWSIAHA